MIHVTSNKKWELHEDNKDKDCAMERRELTLSARGRHKETAIENEKECCLNYVSKDGVLPQTYMMWRYCWGYTENGIQKSIMAKKEDSHAKKKDHQTRKKNVLDKKWEGGEVDSKDQKYSKKKEVR